MAKFISEKIRMKSAARLAAVQATYMIEFGQLSVDEVIKDFINGEVGRYVINDESSEYEEKEEMVEIDQMDTTYFAELMRGVHKEKEQLENALWTSLKSPTVSDYNKALNLFQQALSDGVSEAAYNITLVHELMNAAQ